MLRISKEKEIYSNKSLATNSRQVIAAIKEMIQIATGLAPYKEQEKAAKLLYKGNIVDMKTGEGKTLVIFMAVLMAVRDGRKVYVVTSNDYLSERDYDYSKPLLDSLGIKSVFLKASVGGETETYTEHQVIYATGETLIFDYLRGIKPDYDFAIVDEIDYILVECANHDFSVSENRDDGKVYMPIDQFKVSQSIANVLTSHVKKETYKKEEYLFDLQYKADLLLNNAQRGIEITERGYGTLRSIVGNKVEDPIFMEILLATLTVRYYYLRDVNYIVNGDKIIIINDSNGRTSVDGSNDICIQTAIEVKENVPVTAKALLHNTCSYPVFFSIFKTLTGISGTTSYVPYDFDVIYSKNVKKVKEHFKSQRREIFMYYQNDEDRLHEIIEIVQNESNPILIVSSSDKRSSLIADLLRENTHGKDIMILDNFSLHREKELLESVKSENAVLISSKIVGRGTDIEVPKSFESGLIVILTERLFSERAERQIVGRTGRNGNKGTCYIMTSFDDKIFDLEYKDKKLPTEKYVRKLQKRYEQLQFDMRKHIYIRSKLFFDQDKAIRDRLNEFKTYEEIKAFTIKQEPSSEKDKALKQQTLLLLDKAIAYEFQFLDVHNKILIKKYELIRPYFQQQFLQYNDSMANTLYDTDGFYHRCQEYVETGRMIVIEAVALMLAPIVISWEKENGLREG